MVKGNHCATMVTQPLYQNEKSDLLAKKKVSPKKVTNRNEEKKDIS